jgi:hypothetical protein
MSARQHDFGNVPFEFLNTEIDLGLTFVRAAETEDPEHSAGALGKAREAVKTVRHFLSKPVAGLGAEQVEVLIGKCRALEAAIERVATLS